VREYTVAAWTAAALVVALELLWLRTGLFRQRTYWVAMAIVFGFQFLVDGWLTKLSSPVVRYSGAEFSGWRIGFDTPVEDFPYGFALVTSTLLLWVRAGRRPTLEP
jgi:lycopene cyclase domain-containing protein